MPPYEEYLELGTDAEPGFETMHRIVVEEKKRCQLPDRYYQDQVRTKIFSFLIS